MLHKEFAIDPALVTGIGDISLLDARFGFEKGALISAFPSKWIKEVCGVLADRQSQAAVDELSERLKQLKENSLAKFSRDFNAAEESWLAAAKCSHLSVPFHRVVNATNSEQPVFIKSLYYLSEADFQVETDVIRTADALAQASRLLLRSAERVTLVDPYFCLTKPGYKATLLAMMARCEKPKVTFIVYSEEAAKSDWDSSRLVALNEVLAELPDNVTLKWLSVDDNNTGALHQRALFTAKGGLIYDRGFEMPRDLDQQNTPAKISLMSRSQLEQDAKRFNEAQLVEPLTLVHRWDSTQTA